MDRAATAATAETDSTTYMTARKFFMLLPIYLAVLSYPFLVHFKMIENNHVPFLIMLVLVGFAGMIKFIRTAIILVLMLAVSLLLVNNGGVNDLYFMPPIAINFFVGMIFLNGLRKNQRPVIEKYIEAMEGSVDAEQRRYARSVTIAWVVVLFGLMLESIILSAFFSHEVWSLFTNFINYIILGLMFVVEYIVRLRVFPDRQHMSFVEYMTKLKSISLKSVVM